MSNLQLVKNIIALREASELTQRQVAERLHVTRGAYSNYERGTRGIDLDFLVRLSRMYRIPADDLLTANITSSPTRYLAETQTYDKAGTDPETMDVVYMSNAELHLVLQYRDAPDEIRAQIDHLLLQKK